jgi:cell division protein FtsL
MSPYQQLTKVKHQVQRRQKWQKFYSMSTLNLVAMALILVMGALYLVQVNRATTKGYQIRDLEKKIQAVEDSNRKIELEVAELQSLDSIEERIDKLGMVPVDHIDYVKTPGATVALR